MNWTFWLGNIILGALLFYGFSAGSEFRAMFNLHGLVVVVGGTTLAMILCSPGRITLSALGSALALFLPMRLPSETEIVSEMSRLARLAQTQGGLLALQDESRGFARGFLNRAINVAIATGQSNEARTILEADIRQLRVRRQEDGNLWRTLGTLSPMFGLLGTLLGMIQVLQTVSTPNKVGPAMALALSSAFAGIMLANLVFVPVAGQLRLRAMRETMLLEMILEGVLDLAASKPAALVEMHLASYAQGYVVKQTRAMPAARGGVQELA